MESLEISELAARNRREYGDRYDGLKRLSGADAEIAAARRAELLSSLEGRIQIGCKGTKLDCERLSPGCQVCARGTWSCLFISGRCNCRCFYCPAKQDETSVPMTNTIPFERPRDYVDYVEKFGFEGVSISGGEPLLTPAPSLEYLTAAKRRLGDRIHTWLYTNGTLLTRELLLKLKDAGLDEIRFDIGAVEYRLHKARMAVGVIDCVTVEIPCVPEELERLRGKLVEMADAGISHLNLHQLRLTPHNFPHLVGRGYTFLHGEKVTVLESELAALELIRHGRDRGIDLPVNYCAMVYKNRFQKAAARRQSAQAARKSYEDVTENGYIRVLWLSGNAEALQRQADGLAQSGREAALWNLTRSRDRLYFSGRLWDAISFADTRLSVAYFAASIQPSLSYRRPFVEVELDGGRTLFVEREKASDEIPIEPAEIELLAAFAIDQEEHLPVGRDGGKWGDIRKLEFVPSGLQVYL